MPYIVDAEIISNKPLAPGTMRLVLRSPEIAEECAPGQFVNVHTAAPGQTDPLLKRPLSICRADREKGAIELVYNIVGKGTALLAEMTGRCRIVGPLGKGFPLPENGSVSLLAGGGVGCAPMCFLADELKKRNKDAYIITGFGTKEQIFTKSLLPGAVITTDDGSEGIKGFATAALSEYLDRHPDTPATLYVCGPTPMMKACVSAAAGRPAVKRIWVSLENVMACGIGVCTGCVCRLKTGSGGSEYKRVCKDGPVFDGEAVIW